MSAPFARSLLRTCCALSVVTAALAAGAAPAQTAAKKAPAAPKVSVESAYVTNPLGCVVRLRFLEAAAGAQSRQAKEAAVKEQGAAMAERAHAGVYFYAGRLLDSPADARSPEKAEAEVKSFAGFPRERQAAEAMKCLRSAESALVTLGDALRGPQPAEAETGR